MEKNVDVFAKKDLKRKAATADTKRSAKNLHAKSIASTLERVRSDSKVTIYGTVREEHC